jgi:hypothetical protein
MAYSTSYPPYLIVSAPCGGLASTSTGNWTGGGGNLWYYRSADGVATVTGSSYFSNGNALGMQPFDVVLMVLASTSAPKLAMGIVSGVTAGAGATVGVLTSSSS